jgi:16S rRNA processing protein RimM
MARSPLKSDVAAALPFAALPGRHQQDDEIELGSVNGVFGVSGEVRLFLHHRESELFDRPRDVVLVSPDGHRYKTRLTVRSGAGKRILGRFDGLTDRDLAEAMQDWRIVIASDRLPKLAPGEFYLWQIEGADVIVDGQVVGRVNRVHSTLGSDILEVDVGGEPRFVPCVRELVLSIDAAARRVELVPEALEEG